MITLDAVVEIFAINMRDVLEVWIIVVIYLTNDAPIGVRLVRTDRDGSVGPNALNSLVEKGFGSLSITPRRELEIYQPSV